MESRVEILDRLAKKWSRNNPECIAVETFEEWLIYYDYNATLRLLYIAMNDYAKQRSNKNYTNIELNLDN